MATRQPSTLFDLPNWYKETPGARLSRVSGNPFKAAALPKPALAAPDTSRLNPVLERIKAEQAKLDPLAKRLEELKSGLVRDNATVSRVREEAVQNYLASWQAKGYNWAATPQKYAEAHKILSMPTKPTDSSRHTYDDYGWDRFHAQYQSGQSAISTAKPLYDTTYASYTATLPQYNAAKGEYDALQAELTEAKKGYQGEAAGVSLRRAAPVTDEVPVEQLIAGPMESTAQRQANLGLYSDDLATMMQARKGR